MPKPKSARNERRERERQMAKLVRDREKLARLSPGGAADRPIEVSSASVIEVQARSLPCPLCGGETRVDEHSAQSIGGEMLRVLKVHCHQCGVSRELFFRLAVLQ
jgi:hypothetical protein